MQQKAKLVVHFLFILLFLVPAATLASGISLERGLQQNFKKSRILLVKIERALVSNTSYLNHLKELLDLGESIRTDHQKLRRQFRARGMQLDGVSENALSRHAAVQDRYEQSLARYLSALEALNDNRVTIDEVHLLQVILEEVLPKRKRL